MRRLREAGGAAAVGGIALGQSGLPRHPQPARPARGERRSDWAGSRLPGAAFGVDDRGRDAGWGSGHADAKAGQD